ncbi:MAG TPA: hypothetical protein VF941_11075 [Clostridia bacterium]
MAKNAVTGSVIGGAICGIDGALSGEGFFKGFMNGSITGAEMGALFTIREFGPLLIAMGRISGVEGVIDALRKGNYKLAAFRASVLIASEYVPDKVKDNRVENGVEPKAIENPKESNSSGGNSGGGVAPNGNDMGTNNPRFYRQMSMDEANLTLENGLQPKKPGSNPEKWITEKPGRKFSNDSVPKGTEECIVEFEVTPEYYDYVNSTAIPQQGSSGKTNIKFNQEQLARGGNMYNYGITPKELNTFNRNIVHIKIIDKWIKQ